MNSTQCKKQPVNIQQFSANISLSANMLSMKNKQTSVQVHNVNKECYIIKVEFLLSRNKINKKKINKTKINTRSDYSTTATQ